MDDISFLFDFPGMQASQCVCAATTVLHNSRSCRREMEMVEMVPLSAAHISSVYDSTVGFLEATTKSSHSMPAPAAGQAFRALLEYISSPKGSSEALSNAIYGGSTSGERHSLGLTLLYA